MKARTLLNGYLFPLSVFMGTIIGVGIFGIPHVALKAGFLLTLIYFIVITAVMIAIALRLANIASATRGKHRIPGYVERYLGRKWKPIALPISALSIVGASLAYLVIGGEFLSQLLPLPNIVCVTIFFAVGSIAILRGITSIKSLELILLFALIAIILWFFGVAAPDIEVRNFTIPPMLAYIGYPFGVILFSLWGASLIPELREMVANTKRLNVVIISGILLSALLYVVYTVAVFGVCGADTLPNSLVGFVERTGGRFMKIGIIFGIITTFTSYIALGLTLKNILRLDAAIPTVPAWLVAVLTPFVLFLLGLKNFIDIVGLTGAVLVGGESILILLTYRTMRKNGKQPFSRLAHYALITFIAMGVLLEFLYFIRT